MTTSRALAIITVATLPLAALTARGFLVNLGPEADPAELKTYEGGTEEIAVARKVAAEPAVPPADPVGWGLPKKSRPADEPLEYQVAAALAASARAAAAGGDAIADIAAAVNEIGGLLAEPRRAEILTLPGGPGLVESLQARRAGLQRRSKWLEDRADVARRIAALEALLAGPPDGANETKCLADIIAAGVQFPAVVDDDDADEPANARTKSEDRLLEGIRSRASFRQEQHEAMTAADPEDKLRLLEAFLEEQPSASDPSDAQLVEEAKREVAVAKLAVLRAKAEQAQTAEGMAKALKKWLDAPPAEPANRKAEALAVIRTWLMRNVPEPPADANLPKLRGLQETMMLAGGEEKRMLGMFAPTPSEPGKWRFWWDRADRADPDFKRGRGDVTVPTAKAPMKIPVLVEIEATYGRARERLLGDPLGEGVTEAFAQESGKLADRTAAHLAIQANTNARHELQDAYDKLGEELEAVCRKATAAAREFDAAAKGNALRSLLLP
jgi:hypothetical protein